MLEAGILRKAGQGSELPSRLAYANRTGFSVGVLMQSNNPNYWRARTHYNSSYKAFRLSHTWELVGELLCDVTPCFPPARVRVWQLFEHERGLRNGIVERTFGWMIRWRRLVGDYEKRIDVWQAMILVAMGGNLLRRNAHP